MECDGLFDCNNCVDGLLLRIHWWSGQFEITKSTQNSETIERNQNNANTAKISDSLAQICDGTCQCECVFAIHIYPFRNHGPTMVQWIDILCM